MFKRYVPGDLLPTEVQNNLGSSWTEPDIGDPEPEFDIYSESWSSVLDEWGLLTFSDGVQVFFVKRPNDLEVYPHKDTEATTQHYDAVRGYFLLMMSSL